VIYLQTVTNINVGEICCDRKTSDRWSLWESACSLFNHNDRESMYSIHTRLAGMMSFILNELAQLLCKTDRFITIVANTQQYQCAGKIHDSKAYLSVAETYIPDFRDWQ
jgi:hypothetical protein